MSGIYRHFVAGEFSEAQGIVVSNDRTQKNARTNLSIVPTSKVSIETSVGYLTSKTTTAGEGGSAGAIWGQFALPQRTVAACQYLFTGTVAARVRMVARQHRVAAGSLRTDAELAGRAALHRQRRRSSTIRSPWLSNRFLIGTDYTMEDVNSLLPYQTDSVIVFFLGSRFDGSRSETTQQTTYNTYDYAATAKYDLRKNLQAKIDAGRSVLHEHADDAHRERPALPDAGRLDDLGHGTQGRADVGAPREQHVRQLRPAGVRAEQPALRHRRRARGQQQRVRQRGEVHDVSEDQRLVGRERRAVAEVAHLPGFIDELRLRGAYGGSGQQPLTNSALRTLAPVAGPNGQTTLTNSTIGNPDLKPERVLGTELGLEAGMFNDRIGVDLTLYRDVSHDAILASTVAPSTAFGASTQFVNAGQINKKGFELALKGQVINARRYGWDMQFNVAGTKAEDHQAGLRRRHRHQRHRRQHVGRHGRCRVPPRRLLAVRHLHVSAS